MRGGRHVLWPVLGPWGAGVLVAGLARLGPLILGVLILFGVVGALGGSLHGLVLGLLVPVGLDHVGGAAIGVDVVGGVCVDVLHGIG